jgi:hypothetical protein
MPDLQVPEHLPTNQFHQLVVELLEGFVQAHPRQLQHLQPLLLNELKPKPKPQRS